MRHVKYCAWKLFMLLFIGPLYIGLISIGLRHLIPDSSQRISKIIPFFNFLDNYELTYRLDIAHAMSIVLLVFVWLSWESVLKTLLGIEPERKNINTDMLRRITFAGGVILIVFDCWCFYLAVTASGWGTKNSFSAVLATLGYAVILIFASLFSCLLGRDD